MTSLPYYESSGLMYEIAINWLCIISFYRNIRTAFPIGYIVPIKGPYRFSHKFSISVLKPDGKPTCFLFGPVRIINHASDPNCEYGKADFDSHTLCLGRSPPTNKQCLIDYFHNRKVGENVFGEWDPCTNVSIQPIREYQRCGLHKPSVSVGRTP